MRSNGKFSTCCEFCRRRPLCHALPPTRAHPAHLERARCSVKVAGSQGVQQRHSGELRSGLCFKIQMFPPEAKKGYMAPENSGLLLSFRRMCSTVVFLPIFFPAYPFLLFLVTFPSVVSGRYRNHEFNKSQHQYTCPQRKHQSTLATYSAQIIFSSCVLPAASVHPASRTVSCTFSLSIAPRRVLRRQTLHFPPCPRFCRTPPRRPAAGWAA